MRTSTSCRSTARLNIRTCRRRGNGSSEEPVIPTMIADARTITNKTQEDDQRRRPRIGPHGPFAGTIADAVRRAMFVLMMFLLCTGRTCRRPGARRLRAWPRRAARGTKYSVEQPVLRARRVRGRRVRAIPRLRPVPGAGYWETHVEHGPLGIGAVLRAEWYLSTVISFPAVKLKFCGAFVSDRRPRRDACSAGQVRLSL